MTSSEDTLADQLRQIANVLDQKHCEPVRPDIDISQAVKRLAAVIKRGKLCIEIAWEDWGKRRTRVVEYEIKKEYSSIATANSLSECVSKALVKAQPDDTLDKLAEMMPPAEKGVT